MNKLRGSICLLLVLFGNAAAQDSSYTVSGLEQGAEIIVDEWGVPHIYANTHYDALFVQGFDAARDRRWQIDVWRRRGLGKLSEDRDFPLLYSREKVLQHEAITIRLSPK